MQTAKHSAQGGSLLVVVKAPGLSNVTEQGEGDETSEEGLDSDHVGRHSHWQITSKGKENPGEKELGWKLQLPFFFPHGDCLSPASVTEFRGCLYSVCCMLDIVAATVGLANICHLWPLLMYLDLLLPRRLK